MAKELDAKVRNFCWKRSRPKATGSTSSDMRRSANEQGFGPAFFDRISPTNIDFAPTAEYNNKIEYRQSCRSLEFKEFQPGLKAASAVLLMKAL